MKDLNRKEKIKGMKEEKLISELEKLQLEILDDISIKLGLLSIK